MQLELLIRRAELPYLPPSHLRGPVDPGAEFCGGDRGGVAIS
jgi:hypothetical protein